MRSDLLPHRPGTGSSVPGARRWVLTRAVAFAVLACVLAACAAAGAANDDDPLGAPGEGWVPVAAPTDSDGLVAIPPLPSRDEEVPPLRPDPEPDAEPAPAPDPGGEPVAGPTPEPAPAPSPRPAPEPAPQPTPAPTAPTGRTLAGRVIALDPGHNGGNANAPDVIGRLVDAGGLSKPCNTTGTASNDGWPESAFNLQLARTLRAELERRGATVRMTRTDDTGVGPCIDARGRFGGEVGADLLVSLHADGAGAASRGFHVIRPAGWSGQAPGVVERSGALATAVRDALVAAGLTTSNYLGSSGIDARSDLGTLNLSTVPAVLLEAGNMRNDADLRLLRSSDGQQRIATALADGIETHLG
jgi:N-acetylmuramoyl-L-alanine amidase